MNLIKTSFYTSISQAISILSGLVMVKVVSSKIGPEGMAMTGQFTNTTALLTLFASAAIGVGVIKYLAEYGGDKVAQFRVIRTAFWLIFIASFLTGIITIIFARFFSVSAFKTDEYQTVYILWGSFLVISALSSFLNSVLNGLKLIRYLTIINISTTIIGLIITVILARYFGVFGVLIASNFTVLALFIMHLFFIQRYKWFQFRDFLQGIDFKILKLLSSFILMSLVSGILVPSIQLVVRNKIISDFSFKDAGYWQSVTRISDYYLGFIISVLSIYYLPRLSEIKDKQELKKEIFNGYKYILPAVGIMSFIIWLLRFFIIRLLLTEDFLPSASFYGVQFLADFFKIAAWLLSYLMLAKNLKYMFVITEILFSFIYVSLCVIFMNNYGVIGAVYGFATNCFLYLVTMIIIMKRQKFI